MIRERTRAGLREARTKGRVPGRKPKFTAEQQKEIIEAVSSGRKTSAEIARLFKVHPATVSRIVSQGARRGSSRRIKTLTQADYLAGLRVSGVGGPARKVRLRPVVTGGARQSVGSRKS
jgi:DNA invertase Pin-like site-specific DNA recombinase